MQKIVFGSYDRSTKTLYIPASAENKMISEIYKMIGDVVAIKFYPIDFLLSTAKEALIIFAKVGSVNADEDGVSVKLTTEGVETDGRYARNEVRKLFDKVDSGEYSVVIGALADEKSYFDAVFNERLNLLSPIEVELEVERGGVGMLFRLMEERILKYDAKEDKVGSVLTSKVMAEVGKKLAEEEDQVNVKLAVKTKDGTELAMGVKSLERSGDTVWSAKVSGGKKALDFLKSEKEYTVVLRACFGVICL